MGNLASTALSGAAQRAWSEFNDHPLLSLEWRRVLFFHFEVAPHVVRAQLPSPFELELYGQKAIVSLVALTKRRFRPVESAPLWTRLLPLLAQQRLFNLRTYVRHCGEPGAFFFWSWLSRPWSLPLPQKPLGLTCGFAASRYDHAHESGRLRGVVANEKNSERFAYQAQIDPHAVFTICMPGSLVEFALERYSGYFWHRGAGRVFRAWHPMWRQASVEIQIEQHDLVTNAFPWFQAARFIEADYAPGLDEVQIGHPHPMNKPARGVSRNRHGTSAIFKIP